MVMMLVLKGPGVIGAAPAESMDSTDTKEVGKGTSHRRG